jgi:histidinol-phosphatase (PHP family)
MSWCNYHSHTLFSDGSDEPEAYVHEAVKLGLSGYGFSCHAPVPFDTKWTIKPEKLGEYLSEIERLKLKYAGQINLFKSLEIDFIPGNPICWDNTRSGWNLDYIIASVHFVSQFPGGKPWNIDYTQEHFDEGLASIFRGDIRAATEEFYRLTISMVEDMKPDIVGHLDKFKIFAFPYFSENEQWYKAAVVKTLQSIRAAGSILEINTRGLYKRKPESLYPSAWILRLAFQMDLPVTICSDCHSPSEILLGYSYAAQVAWDAGYRKLSIFSNGEWQELPFTPASGVFIS